MSKNTEKLKFICPVCRKPLSLIGGSYKCENNHTFDLSRKGYVNLFQGKGSKAHGDDKVMIKARTRFLDKGFYGNFQGEVCRLAVKYSPENCKIIDCGCGECYYTARIYSELEKCGKSPEIMGIDISKEAVSAGARRCDKLSLAVGSVFHLPCENSCFDLLVTLFSPFCKEEYKRVLKKGGYLIYAIPLENHLWELKEKIYDVPYKNTVSDFNIEGFEVCETSKICSKIHLSQNEEILDLFSMTPYYYKTSHGDRKKLEGLNSLDVTTEFLLIVYKKI